MIILRLLFLVSAFFVFLVVALFTLLLTKGRIKNMQNWQAHVAKEKPRYSKDDNVIEGEYKVLDDHNKD